MYTLYLFLISMIELAQNHTRFQGKCQNQDNLDSNTCRRLAQRCSDFERQLGDDVFVEMLEEDGSVPESGLN